MIPLVIEWNLSLKDYVRLSISVSLFDVFYFILFINLVFGRGGCHDLIVRKMKMKNIMDLRTLTPTSPRIKYSQFRSFYLINY